MTTYKVLEVVSGFGLGGAEKALVTRLKYRPKTISTVILNMRPEIDSKILTSKLASLDCRVESFALSPLKRLINSILFFRKENFDLVIVRTPLDAIRFSLFKFLKFRNKPLLFFEVHSRFVADNKLLMLAMLALLRILKRQIDARIAVSIAVSRGSLCYGFNSVHVCYLGSDVSTTHLQGRSNQQSRLIFIGRLVAVKRPLWLLERLRSLNESIKLPKGWLTVVGEGPLRIEMKKFTTENGLDEVVKFEEVTANPEEFYLSATHLVSCSLSEGLPLTFFEAKLSGLCILTTPSGGGAEILDSNDFLLNSFEESEFENALLHILNFPPPNSYSRRKIQAKSTWMSSKECSCKYYELLSRLVVDYALR